MAARPEMSWFLANHFDGKTIKAIFDSTRTDSHQVAFLVLVRLKKMLTKEKNRPDSRSAGPR